MTATEDERAQRARDQIGLRLKEAHYPGRAPIDSYGNGGFRFADMSHRGSILCLPSGIYGWNSFELDLLEPADFDRVFDEGELDFLLLGTGPELRPLPAKLKTAFKGEGIRIEPMSTGAAVRTLNVMLAEDRRVGAALLAVD